MFCLFSCTHLPLSKELSVWLFNCISITVFLYFNSKLCKMLSKKLPSQKCKRILSNCPKTSIRSLKPQEYPMVFFYFQSCVNLRWYKSGCMWLTTLFTVIGPRYICKGKKKGCMYIQNSLICYI